MRGRQSLLERLNLMKCLVCLLTLTLRGGVTLHPELVAALHILLQISPWTLQAVSFLQVPSCFLFYKFRFWWFRCWEKPFNPSGCSQNFVFLWFPLSLEILCFLIFLQAYEKCYFIFYREFLYFFFLFSFFQGPCHWLVIPFSLSCFTLDRFCPFFLALFINM